MTDSFEVIISISCYYAIAIRFCFDSATSVGAGHCRTIQVGRRQGAPEFIEVTVNGGSDLHIHIIRSIDKPALIGNIYAVAVADRYLTCTQRQRVAAENTAFRRGGLAVTRAIVGINGHSSIRIFLTGRTDVIGTTRALHIPSFRYVSSIAFIVANTFVRVDVWFYLINY